MCRWVAYKGEPIYLEDLVAKPHHSLIDQSMHATEGKSTTNGDGFGLGWYGERERPGLYREVRPAWNDSNLRDLVHQIRSRLFFAHVRASTGTATERTNCHPFVSGRWMFMHNGQIGGFAKVRRALEGRIPEPHYHERLGTTDSEVFFLMLFGHGLESDPAEALCATLAEVREVVAEARIDVATRFTACLSDGVSLYAIRYASDDQPPTLYHAETEAGLIVVSEPIDAVGYEWHGVPSRHVLSASPTGHLRIESMH